MIEIRTSTVTGVNPYVPLILRPPSGANLKLIPTSTYLKCAPILLWLNGILLLLSLASMRIDTGLIWLLVPAFALLIAYRTACLRTVEAKKSDADQVAVAPFVVVAEHVAHNSALTSLALLAGMTTVGAGASLVGMLVVVTALLSVLPLARIALHCIRLRR